MNRSHSIRNIKCLLKQRVTLFMPVFMVFGALVFFAGHSFVCAAVPAFSAGSASTAVAVSAAFPRSDTGLYRESRRAVLQKDWGYAIQLLKELQRAFPASKYRVEGMYWLAYSLDKQASTRDAKNERMGEKKEALQWINRLINNHKDTPWVDDAKILRLRISIDLIKSGESKYTSFIVEALNAEDNENVDLKMVALDSMMRVDRKQAVTVLRHLFLKSASNDIRDSIIFILRRYNQEKLIVDLLEDVSKRGLISVRESDSFMVSPHRKIIPPKVMRRDPLYYPGEALQKGITGRVILEVWVDKKGRVHRHKVKKSADTILEKAAVDIVRQWRYVPHILRGLRKEVTFTVTFEFTMEYSTIE